MATTFRGKIKATSHGDELCHANVPRKPDLRPSNNWPAAIVAPRSKGTWCAMTHYAWTIRVHGWHDLQKVTTLAELHDILEILELPGVAPPMGYHGRMEQ